jgi:hypothetical protein
LSNGDIEHAAERDHAQRDRQDDAD